MQIQTQLHRSQQTSRRYLLAKVIAVAAVGCLAACEGPPPEDLTEVDQAIVRGGVPPENAYARATVALGFANSAGYEYYCSGVLIGNRYALTAMHCVVGGPPQLILFGPNARQPTATRPAVRSASVCGTHLCGPGQIYSDLGIVEFDGGLPPGAIAAALPALGSTLPLGTPIFLLGYGGDGNGIDGIKRFGYASVSGFGAFGQVQFSKGAGFFAYATACAGDSGGPGFRISNADVPTVAVTTGGANCDDFSDSLQVSKHLLWIRRQMAISTRFVPKPRIPLLPSR